MQVNDQGQVRDIATEGRLLRQKRREVGYRKAPEYDHVQRDRHEQVKAGSTLHRPPPWKNGVRVHFYHKKRVTTDAGSHEPKSLLLATQKYDCLIDAYVLMTNHVHLLATGTTLGIATPENYPWSSFGYNASGVSDSLITAHKCYTALADTHAARRTAYRNLFERTIDDDEINAIRAHVNQGKVLGSERFQAQVKAALNRRVELSRPGRPRNVL